MMLWPAVAGGRSQARCGPWGGMQRARLHWYPPDDPLYIGHSWSRLLQIRRQV